jgi:hypothetical protein
VEDVNRLFSELGKPKEKIRVPMSEFSHFDFIWGIDAKRLVYAKTMEIIRTIEVYHDYNK